MANTQQLVTVDSVVNTVTTSTATPPGITVNVFSVDNIPGVVAANNFLTFFNPVGSGKTMLLIGLFVSCSTTGASASTEPMRGARITAAPTGGTVNAAATVNKFLAAGANTVADIRTGNPTATATTFFFNSPAFNSGAQGTGQVHQILTEGPVPFTLVPGEGVVVQTLSGTVNQRWNISLVWGEY